MKRALWHSFAALLVGVAFVASPAASAAKKKSTDASTASTDPKSDKASTKTEKVNLNTADEKDIAAAKGVGDKLAKELVKNRPYKTWDDVSKVKGVGTGKKLDSLKKVLKLSDGVAAKDDTADKKDTKKKSSSKVEETAAPAAAGAAAGGAAAGSSKAKPASTEKAEAPKLAPGTKININTASAEELDKLPEIGPTKAKAIVDYRAANGKFASPEDIMKVSGIKEGTYAKIKDYIVVR